MTREKDRHKKKIYTKKKHLIMYYTLKKEVMRCNNQTRNRISAPFIKYLISPTGSFLTTQPIVLQHHSKILERFVYSSISETIWHIKGLIIFLIEQPTYPYKLQLPTSLAQVGANMLILKLPVTFSYHLESHCNCSLSLW